MIKLSYWNNHKKEHLEFYFNNFYHYFFWNDKIWSKIKIKKKL